MICSDFWHKYHKLNFKIVMSNKFISRAVRRVKIETILKYHEWYFMPNIMYKSCYYLFFPSGVFPSDHACQAAQWMNQARNMHTASNLYIKLATPGWPFSWNTRIKVTSEGAIQSGSCVQAPTVSCIVTLFACESFGICHFCGSYMREINLI